MRKGEADMTKLRLIESVLGVNELQIMQLMAIVCAIYFLPLWIAAGLQDRKRHEVAGPICMAICLGCAVFGMIFDGLVAVLITMLCGFFVFSSHEIECFGQADFLVLNHFFVVYGYNTTGLMLSIIAGVVWLVCLLGHLVIYKDKDGKRWVPFSGTFIPAIPSYAVSVVIMTFLRFILTPVLFFAGF